MNVDTKTNSMSEINRFLGWASAGSLSVCLVFVALIPTLSGLNAEILGYSMLSFVIAIPMLCGALVIYKGGDDLIAVTNVVTVGVCGNTLMIVGFLIFLYSFDTKLALALFLSASAATSLAIKNTPKLTADDADIANTTTE